MLPPERLRKRLLDVRPHFPAGVVGVDRALGRPFPSASPCALTPFENKMRLAVLRGVIGSPL
jgi:hypothetical protein